MERRLVVVLPHVDAADVGPCRETLNGVVGCCGCLLGLTGIVECLVEAVALRVEHRDAVVKIDLIFCVLLRERHVYTFFILHKSRVGHALPPVGYAHRAAQVEHGLHIVKLAGKGISALGHTHGIGHAPHVDKRHGLLAHEPAACGVGGVQGQGTVGKGQRHRFVAKSVLFCHAFEHGIGFLGCGLVASLVACECD